MSLPPRYKVFPPSSRDVYFIVFHFLSVHSPLYPSPPFITQSFYKQCTHGTRLLDRVSSHVPPPRRHRNYQEISAKKTKESRKKRKNRYGEATAAAANATAWSRATRVETESFSNLNLHTKRGRFGKFNR